MESVSLVANMAISFEYQFLEIFKWALRGSGYLGYVDSNQGYNLYKWVICPLTTVINLHITSYIQYPEPLSRSLPKLSHHAMSPCPFRTPEFPRTKVTGLLPSSSHPQC